MAPSQLPRDRKIYDVAIVGAGFSGLGMAIHLKKAGTHSFVILEKTDGVGGTWRVNSYPGAACDIPTHLYSYSFEQWPYWSRIFGPQQEILQYIEHCADKYDLRPHLRFNQEITKVFYDPANAIWHTQTKDGNTILSRIAIGATGPLNIIKYPEIPGVGSFKGPAFHTARWDHSVDLTGKRVGIIGTGASAIQVIPTIADQVSELTVFQRTPPWVIHRPDRDIGPKEQKLYKTLPFLQRMYRNWFYWSNEAKAVAFVVFPGAMKIAQNLGRKNLRKGIPDPELREKLTPKFTMGCKRVLLSNTYYPAMAKETTHLVTDSISEITETGITTVDGKHHELDVIIYATGFWASENVAPFETRGKDGQDLRDLWSKGGEAFLGTTITGFPNFFLIVGPNTGLGHNSMIYIIESQIKYILSALRKMKRKGLKEVEIRSEVQEAYNRKVQKRLQGTIWSKGGCMSWYLNENGKNTTLWPGFTFEFRRKTRRFRLGNYEIGQ